MADTRLFDYFAVYGLSESSDILIQPSSSADLPPHPPSQHDIISDIQLRILHTHPANTDLPFQRSLNIPLSASSSFNLTLVFGRLNAKLNPAWDGTAISTLAPIYCHCEGSLLKIPASKVPLPLSTVYSCSHSASGFNYYAGDFDITIFSGEKQVPNRAIALTVSHCGVTGLPPLSDIILITGPNKLEHVPEGYRLIDLALGLNRNLFVCYKRAPDPLLTVYKPQLVDRFPLEDHTDSPLSATIPMFCFGDGFRLASEQEDPKLFSFVFTAYESNKVPRIYITALVFYEPLPESLATILHISTTASHKIYAPKAVCLVSHWPFLDQCRTILKELYRMCLSSFEVPIERVVSNLIEEVPLPSPGGPAIVYSLGRAQVEFARFPAEYLTDVSDSCIEFVFRSLTLEDVLIVWSAVMAERKILLISQRKALLTYVATGLTSLLYPLKWDQVLIPVLPAPLKSYIEAIFPYIIGVSPDMLTEEIEIPVDAVQVNLDTGQVSTNEYIAVPPTRLYKKLIQRLRPSSIYKVWDPKRDTVDDAFSSIIDAPKEESFDLRSIRAAFIYIQTKLLKHYDRYLLISSSPSKIQYRKCFNAKAFLKHKKVRSSEDFFKKVTETSMFAHFVESKATSTQDQKVMFFEKLIKTSQLDCAYSPPNIVQALAPNPIGFESSFCFKYTRFPYLNSDLYEAPRTQLKPRLCVPHNFTNDSISKLCPAKWAKFLLGDIYRCWVTLATAHIPKYKVYAKDIFDLTLAVVHSMKKHVCRLNKRFTAKSCRLVVIVDCEKLLLN